MRQATNRSLTLLLILGIWILPLLGTLGLEQIYPPDTTSSQPFAIDLRYSPTDAPGVSDKLEITAPPNMELAVYLNDRLLDVVKTDALGRHDLDMPVLPLRRNEITALPTQIDSSTLPLFYDPKGFQKLTLLPAHVRVDEPFLAATILQEDGLHLYGSSAPDSNVEVQAENCFSNVLTEVMSDEEGSFHAVLPIGGNADLPKQFCLRVTPDSDAEAADEFLVAAPVASPARGEGVWNRSIDLQFSATEVRLVFAVEMPDDYLVYRNLAEGNLSESQFIEYVFGGVTLNAFLDPRQMAWRQEKQAGSDRVRVLIETQPLAYLIPEDTATVFQLDTHSLSNSIPPYGLRDTVTVTLDGVRVTENSPPADSSEDATQIWRGIFAQKPTLTFWVSRNPLPLTDPIGRAQLLDAISEIISSLQIQPSALLRETLEGQIIGVLPARVPVAVQAQVYDTYRAVYLSDPFTDTHAAKPTFQTFLRDLPSRIPGWITSLLFGMLWLIPSALTLWTLRKESAVVPDLAYLATGVAALVLLTINWLSLLNRIGIERETYIHWLTAGLLTFVVFYLPFPSWTRWLSGHPVGLFTLSVFFAPVSVLVTRFVLAVLPDGWVSVSLTGLALLGLFLLLWLGSQAGKEEAKRPAMGIVLAGLIVVFGFSLPIQSLPLSAQLSGAFGVSSSGVALIRPLLPLALLLGIVMTLRRRHDRPLGGKLTSLERGYARVILVAFTVGLSPVWGFLPLSIVIGLIMAEWLVPSALLSPDKVVLNFVEKHHDEGVKQLLVLNRQTRLWRATESNLRKKVREGEMEDENYHKQREKLEASAHELEQPKYLKTANSEITLPDLAFNFGAGPNHRDNLKHALAWGLLLAAPMLLVYGWPLAAAGIDSALPFPILGLVIRLVVFAAQYVAAAVFLGYFFPYVRGRNGLEKGGWLALTIVLSFLPYHILFASSINDWTAIIIWAGLALAFNLLVGFLAFDIRTLTRFKLGWHRLPDLYDFGAFAVYLTGSGVPLITTTFTAIFGSLEDLVPSILKVMFPSFTLSGAQFELLQMLLDLASRIASGVLK